MRLLRLLFIFFAVTTPGITAGEVLHLKDGSSIQGRLVRFANDTLYFETTFGSEVRVARGIVVRLEFSDSAALLGGGPGAPPESAVPGTLAVSFEDFKVTSRVSVHRDRDADAIVRANAIECALFLGPKKVFSAIDSVTDKTIREGPDTVYRNDMSPKGFQVTVAPGSYTCRLFLRNSMAPGQEDRFVGGPLRKDLLIENVKVLPGETTQLRIGMMRKMKIGSAQLFVVQ